MKEKQQKGEEGVSNRKKAKSRTIVRRGIKQKKKENIDNIINAKKRRRTSQIK